MTPAAGALYRLRLARRSLLSANDNHARGNWRDSALFARAAVEHASKAMLACFTAVPRTDEPARVLELALSTSAFPSELRSEAEARLPELAAFGLAEHILLSYGDEEHGVDPWALVDGARATSRLAVAVAMLSLAERCCALYQDSQATSD